MNVDPGQVIETLDRRKGLEQNFLWPLPEQTDEEAAEGEDHEVKVDDIQESQEASWEDQPVKDKLISALRYLRAHYFYCLHCGHQVRFPISASAHVCNGKLILRLALICLIAPSCGPSLFRVSRTHVPNTS